MLGDGAAIYFAAVVILPVSGAVGLPLSLPGHYGDSSWSSHAGFALVLSNSGLEYAKEVAVPIIEKDIAGVTVPDVSTDAHTPLGTVTFELKSIKATSANLGSVTIASENAGMHLGISGASIDLSGDWSYRQHDFPHIKDHGSVDIKASSLGVSIIIAAGITPAHEPSLRLAGCSSSIGHLDIKFHGGASWLYNLFSGSIADTVKKQLNNELCSVLGTEMGVANTALAKLPTNVSLDSWVGINFELLAPPNTTASFLMTQHRGEFFPRHTPSVPPFLSAAFAVPDQLPRMLYLFVSPYLAQTAGWAYAQTDRLTFKIEASDIPPGFPLQLNTSAFQLILPTMYKTYPNLPMSVIMNASDPVPFTPMVSPAGINVTANLEAAFAVQLPNGSAVPAFTLYTVTALNANASCSQNSSRSEPRFHFELSFVRIEAALKWSGFGQFPPAVLTSLLEVIFNRMILPQINHAGAVGFPLPLLDGVALVHPEIVLTDGLVRIDTDVSYNATRMVANRALIQGAGGIADV